jgi:PKD repeat protein
MRKSIVPHTGRSLFGLSVIAGLVLAGGIATLNPGAALPAFAQTVTVTAGGPYSGVVGTPITVIGTAPGDGSSASGQTATHAYVTANTYTVSVFVTDLSNGHTGSATTTATVTGGTLGTLTIGAGGPYTGTAGTAVTMTGTATGSTLPQYSWSFGDGTTGAGQTTTHVYSSAGTFSVTLTVVDSLTSATGSAATAATISGSGTTCVPSVTVPIGTVCPSNSTTCVPGVTVPIGTVCPSNSTTCVPGVTVPVGTNCGITASAYASTCGIGVLCGSSSPYSGSPYGSYGTYGSYPQYGASGNYGTGTTATTATAGCTSGQPPCAVGQSCTPAASNSLSCTPTGTTPATTTAAGPVTAGISTGDSTPPAGTPSYMPPLSASSTNATPATANTAGGTTTAGAQQGTPVTLQAGWNLVAGIQGLTNSSLLSGPFAYSASSNSYQAVATGQTIQGGAGYWVDLSTSVTLNLPATGVQAISDTLPAGAYMLIGNPTGVQMNVTGPDVVNAYNAATSTYQPTTTLAPGQGAWAYSGAGAIASLTPATTAFARPGS